MGGPAVGLDLGGTWVRAIAEDGPRRRRAWRAPRPPSTPIPLIARRALAGLGLRPGRPRALVLAARGVWSAAERRGLARALAGLASAVRVLSDVEAAYLGALGARPGVLLLAGTGSIALARDARGRWRRAGGLGPVLGDEGSAFWIGREWLRARCREGMPAGVRRVVLAPEAPTRVAALAPAVLRRARRRHRVARRIAAAAADHLAALIAEATRGMPASPPVEVSWAGRLMANRAFRATVLRAVRRRGLRVRPHAPRATPVEAALAMAMSLARTAGDPRAPLG